MGGRRIARTSLIAALVTSGAALVTSGAARAQPKDPGGEIEIEPAPAPSATEAPAKPADAAPARPADAASAKPADAAPVKDARVARRWLAAAQLLMQKGAYYASRNRTDEAKAQFDNAITAFQRAIDAGDDPNLRLELAIAHDRVGRFDEAVKQLRVLVASPAGVRPDVLKKATARLDELSAKIGVVTLTVTPPGASVTLGGIELGSAPLPEPLVLMPGTYTLSFQADGFQPKEAEIKVEAGSENERAIQLEAVQVIVEPVQPAVAELPAQDDAPGPRSKLPLYIGAGVTGVGVIGATVLGILAIRQQATFAGAKTPRLEREDARDNGKRLALAADLSLGVAVVAAGFTATWYFVKYKQHPRKPDDRRSPSVAAKLGVVPWVQSQSGGVTIAGSF